MVRTVVDFRCRDYSRFSNSYRAWLILAISLVTPFYLLPLDRVEAHELEDGVVERDNQVVIFPDRIEIQYTVELNEQTRGDVWSQFENEQHLSTDTLEAWKQFRTALAQKLIEQIRVKIDQRPLALQVISSETVEKHSIRLYLVLAAKVTVAKSSQLLEIHDRSFEDFDGYHRLAIKGRRQVLVNESSVPVIVSQLKRTPWDKLSKEQRLARTRAHARFEMESLRFKNRENSASPKRNDPAQ